MPNNLASVTSSSAFGDYAITVACECYSHEERVKEVLARLPDFDWQLVWGPPSVPGPSAEADKSDLALVVADKNSLATAVARLATHRAQENAALLIYLQDDDAVPGEDIPGLVLPLANLAAGFSGLVDALFTPVIPHGLVGVEWVDTRYFLLRDGRMVIEEARGPDPEATIEAAVTRLRERAAGRKIAGLQASLLCSRDKLAMQHVSHLASACRTVIDDDAVFFIAAPMLEGLESGPYQVRLAARIAGPSGADGRS